jgi:hypothetical protein
MIDPAVLISSSSGRLRMSSKSLARGGIQGPDAMIVKELELKFVGS